MEKIKCFYIKCKNVEEKTKVILTILSKYTWNSGSTDIMPEDMSLDSFSTSLIMVVNKNSFGQTSGEITSYSYKEVTAEELFENF